MNNQNLEDRMSKMIVAVGALDTGYTFYGPFGTIADTQSIPAQAGESVNVLSLEEPEMSEELKEELAAMQLPNSTIVITGNPADGLFFYGPFPDSDEASHWAGIEHDGQVWWIVELHASFDLALNPASGRRPDCK